jgi:tetratricopeptide (TPR) repeat protein
MRILFVSAAALLAAAPAAAGVTVIGSSAARMCFEATESRLAPALETLRRCDEALNQEALNKRDMVATLVNRGIVKVRLGRHDEAIADFDAASARDPDQAEAYLNKGLALLRAGDEWERALPLFDTALAKRTRKPALAYYGRAVANELGGRVKEAYRDYHLASRTEPDWSAPKIQLARFKLQGQ